MRRRISVTLDSELVDWLDKINESDSRDRSRTIQQYVKLAKRAIETDEIQHDPVCHIAFSPTRRFLLQDDRDTTATILQFPGVADNLTVVADEVTDFLNLGSTDTRERM